jgi:hypothetical protein
VVEAKPPNVEISVDDVEQAFSYAFLPEVAAGYFVLCNGRRFLIFKTIDGPSAPPLVELTYEQLGQKLQVVSNVLGPSSFRRALMAQHIDTARPLALCLPSSIHVISGEIEYTDALCEVPQVAEKIKRLVGVRVPVENGYVWRLENRLAFRGKQGFLHRHHQTASQAIGAGEAVYFSSDLDISSDPAHPNIFESTNSYEVRRGQPQFDLFTQEQTVAEVDCTLTTYTEAIGRLEGSYFAGKFFGGGDIAYDLPGNPVLTFDLSGTFRLRLLQD